MESISISAWVAPDDANRLSETQGLGTEVGAALKPCTSSAHVRDGAPTLKRTHGCAKRTYLALNSTAPIGEKSYLEEHTFLSKSFHRGAAHTAQAEGLISRAMQLRSPPLGHNPRQMPERLLAPECARSAWARDCPPHGAFLWQKPGVSLKQRGSRHRRSLPE